MEMNTDRAEIAKFAMIPLRTFIVMNYLSYYSNKNHLELRLDVVRFTDTFANHKSWVPHIFTPPETPRDGIRRWNIHDAPRNQCHNLHSWIPWSEENLFVLKKVEYPFSKLKIRCAINSEKIRMIAILICTIVSLSFVKAVLHTIISTLQQSTRFDKTCWCSQSASRIMLGERSAGKRLNLLLVKSGTWNRPENVSDSTKVAL